MVNLQHTPPENSDITDFTLFDSVKLCKINTVSLFFFFFRSTSTAHRKLFGSTLPKEEIRHITSIKGERHSYSPCYRKDLELIC